MMDKKQRLLEAALKLFVAFGFHDTPTSKIAKEAGIASGTLFYFFPTKDELVKALYLDIKSRMSNYILDTINEVESLKPIMKGYYTAKHEWALMHKTEFRFIEQFNSSPYLNQIAQVEIQRHIQPVKDLLEKGISDKVIKPMDVDIIYMLVSGHTFSINQYLNAKQFSKSEENTVIDETFDLLWDMIKV